jgi:hypothetical protein
MFAALLFVSLCFGLLYTMEPLCCPVISQYIFLIYLQYHHHHHIFTFTHSIFFTIVKINISPSINSHTDFSTQSHKSSQTNQHIFFIHWWTWINVAKTCSYCWVEILLGIHLFSLMLIYLGIFFVFLCYLIAKFLIFCYFKNLNFCFTLVYKYKYILFSLFVHYLLCLHLIFL